MQRMEQSMVVGLGRVKMAGAAPKHHLAPMRRSAERRRSGAYFCARAVAVVGILAMPLVGANDVAAQAKNAKAPAAGQSKKLFTKMTQRQLLDYGKHLVRECTTCHSLFGHDEGIPVMVGLTVARFKDTIDLYRRGKRDNLAMVNVSRSLDDQQIHALAVYLGGVKPSAQQTAARDIIDDDGLLDAGIDSLGKNRYGPAVQKTAADQTGGVWRPTWRHMTQIKLQRAEGWVAKGKALLNLGRVSEARLWLERAAEYGVVQAALLLGSSFDPNFARSGASIGSVPNPEKARDWYIYARQLGSQEAGQRLADLPAG